ncbi:endonuclease/exonuclease/phosphatase family protein [Pseudonocardia cypriaca]|uniref:Endonuclease/exonuclease/phosphatase (EEP) superfamily protein YafD n=1 Tax=Pseudonocardia cypriaca TaxID=882449 RepID=A0A543FR99_9PSEU|nr:endonuclease/exonuclease/phosphatase family protein [Pseudonocardia cypriaca]TQM36367.1 endonuclease/exonuclease/phosphatase (EEP) superfamily protein YafD [Pseudonocardia cypriaca]
MTAPPDRLAPAFPLPPPPPGVRRRRDVARYLTAVVFTLVVAVGALPDLVFGLDRRSPFVQLVSMRPWILGGVLALLVLLLVVMLFERRVLPFVAGVLAVLLVGVGLTLPRVVPDPVPAGGTPFKVLAFNTYEGDADVEQLVALIEEQRPDAAAIVEAGPDFAEKLEPLVEPLGYRLRTAKDSGDDVEDVTAVVSDRLGDVDFEVGDDTSAFPYVEVTGGALGELRFVAFHSIAPVPGYVPEWNSDLALVSRWCEGPTPTVVAGDFNATLDHSALRAGTAGCGDAAAQRGAGLVPTWGPTPGLRSIGPQIDHVFATDGITAETFDVRDIEGSDHRAIMTTLRIPN